MDVTQQQPEPSVPAGTPSQPMLPLDEPVPFALTVRGRRAVAAAALPALHVVRGGGARPVDLDDPAGTGRVRARALHRAGVPVEDIAAELGAEPLHVEGWVADLPPGPAPLRVVRGSGRGGPGRRGPAVPAVAGVEDDRRAAAPGDHAWGDGVDAGMAEASARLGAEPALRAGLGVAAGLLREDHHALLLEGTDAGLLGAAVAWARQAFGADLAAARLLVVHHPQEQGDRLAHRAAQALGLELQAVATTRDASRPAGAPVLRWRLADPALAARAAGWRRALLAELRGHPAAWDGGPPGGVRERPVGAVPPRRGT